MSGVPAIDAPMGRMTQPPQHSVISDFLSPPKQQQSTERVEEVPAVPAASHLQEANNAASGEPLIPEPVGGNHESLTNDATSPELGEDRPSYAPRPSNLHAARLMQDPTWRLENTSAGGFSFVEGYFRQSRLHYLATWKSELKISIRNARVEGRFQERSKKFQTLQVCQRTRTLDSPSTPFTNSSHPLNETDSSPRRTNNDIKQRRFIMHCDFDCFFVSASLTSHPELRGQPVVVCHAHGEDHSSVSSAPKAQSTSEVACASYEARAMGVKNGMR